MQHTYTEWFTDEQAQSALGATQSIFKVGELSYRQNECSEIGNSVVAERVDANAH